MEAHYKFVTKDNSVHEIFLNRYNIVTKTSEGFEENIGLKLSDLILKYHNKKQFKETSPYKYF